MDRLEVLVDQDCIDLGTPGSGPECPIALALLNTHITDCYVGYSTTRIGYPDEKKDSFKRVDLTNTSDVTDWIEDYDAGGYVEPFKAILEDGKVVMEVIEEAIKNV